MAKVYEPRFGYKKHEDCQSLTQLTIENLPRDGTVGRSYRFRRGTDVWQPDDRADRLYFLLQGEVGLVVGDRDGRELLLRVVGVGEPFGELCFCGGETERRRDTARAHAESMIVEVRPDDLLSHMQQNREGLGALVTTFCIRIGEAERRIGVLAQRGAAERLGKLLLQLATPQAGAPAGAKDGVQIAPHTATLVMTHDELARMAALSRQQVTLTLGAFRRRGLVSYDRTSPLTIHVEQLVAYIDGGQATRI